MVDGEGTWGRTRRSGTWEQWNLEDTASDSGWISFPLGSGITGSGSPAYRVKGGVVYFRGTLTRSGSWASGGNVFATGLPSSIRPDANALRAGASSATPGMLLQMTSTGQLEMWLPSSLAGSTTGQVSPMFYPIG